MSLIRRTRARITAKQVAEMLGCSHKTVLNGGAGTQSLTKIRNGTKQVRYLLDEVTALVQQQEGLSKATDVQPPPDKTYGQPHAVSL